jgi:hypothetical protein
MAGPRGVRWMEGKVPFDATHTRCAGFEMVVDA